MARRGLALVYQVLNSLLVLVKESDAPCSLTARRINLAIMLVIREQIGLGIVLAVLLRLAAPTSALPLAKAGKPTASVLLAGGATVSEQMAANEIAGYLGQISEATFQVQSEDQPPGGGSRIFVGPTAFARSHGLAADKLGAEESIGRMAANDLIILGGRPRGTLDAAYHFLEDVLDVHWWNPFADKATLVLAEPES